MKLILSLAALLVLWAPAHAVEVQKIRIADAVEVAGTQLVLNGAGLRKKFFMKIYVGALYLPASADTPDAVFEQAGPKRVSMHFMFGDITAKQMADGWIESFEDNLSEAEMTQVRSRLDDFNGLFTTVQEGDVIVFDYLPGQGTRVSINDQVRGTIPGRDFNTALLKVWLGDRPASDAMKSAWLGKT